MQYIHKYLFRQCLVVFAGLLVLIVSILLLERVLRIADFVSRSPGNVAEAGEMLINLIPHYMGIGIPAAFFLAVLITVSRISRSGELVSIWNIGKSLFMISRPFMFMSVILASLLLIVTGYLQPVSRYQYRSLLNSVTQASIETVFNEGKFAQVDNWTVWTQGVDRTSGDLESSFMLERSGDGRERILASESGVLQRVDGEVAQIAIETGMGATVESDFSLGNRVDFEALQWAPPSSAQDFRARGKDERELTLLEIWSRQGPDRRAAIVSGHDQLARFTLILLLPLIAIPLGLSYGRNPPSSAVLIGLLILITIQQLLELGKSLSLSGALPVWLGSWGVIGVVSILSLALYLRSAMTMAQPPLASLPSFNFANLFRRSKKVEPSAS